MDPYLAGHKLIGDDFDLLQIKQWFDSEVEGYANLGSKNRARYKYIYHEMNKLHGFNKVGPISFDSALGIGSAYGDEFLPVIDRISKITIVEPSDNLKSDKIGHVVPDYVKPQIDGKLPFGDNTFDLITCFGTLHHVPNVTSVLNEIIRVLKNGGFLLLREPVISMGDWNFPRQGLTKNERGIPIRIFDKIFMNADTEVLSREFCFTLTPSFSRIAKKFLSKPLLMYKPYVYFDKLLSKLLKFNLKYHPESQLDRIRPSNIFYVVRKGRTVNNTSD